MRLGRWEIVRAQFPDLGDMNVLDLGGTMEWWVRSPVLPKHVTVVNLEIDEGSAAPWLTAVVGDACHADSLLAGQSFDLVFSNSLIEHVGGHGARVALAHVISRWRHGILYRLLTVISRWSHIGSFLPCSSFRCLSGGISLPDGHWATREAGTRSRRSTRSCSLSSLGRRRCGRTSLMDSWSGRGSWAFQSQ